MIKPYTHPLFLAVLTALFLSLASVFGQGAVQAQTAPATTADQVEAWSDVADEAERSLQFSTIDDDVLDTLRTDLIAERSQAREALEPLKERVTSLAELLDGLGDPPGEDQSEPAEIAERRVELTKSVADARVPVVAIEAFISRADELIDRIDTIRRDRFSEELTSRGDIPVMPAAIAAAWTETRDAFAQTADQAQARLAAGEGAAAFNGRLPGAIAFVAVGLLILFVLRRRLTTAIDRRLQAAATRGHRALWGVLLDLSRTIVPIAASLALITGFRQINPGVATLTAVIDTLPMVAVVIVVSQWIGRSLFKPAWPELSVLPVWAQRPRGQVLTTTLGFLAAALLLVDGFSTGAELSQTAAAVLGFPVLVAGALVLFPLSLVLGVKAPEEDETEEPGKSAGSVVALMRGLSWIAFVVAIFAPLLALAGYHRAAEYIFLPFVYSYLLIGAFLVVFWLFREWVESWLEGGTTRAQTDFRAQFRLLPVVFGMLLTVGALPLLALIWGARLTDVQSAATWFSDGVTVGDTQLSASDLLVFLLVFAFGYMATRAIQSVFRNSVLPRTSADIGARTAIVSGIGYVGVFLAALAAISATGLSLSNLAIVAGALSIGVGFGLQTIVSNFVSGIILLVERPIKLGDWIEVSGYSGYVRRISVRATEIETFDRASVILPNADLVANPVLNWTHTSQLARVIVPIGVAYGTDPRRVEKILLEIAEGEERFVRYPAPFVVFQGFGADSLDFELRGIARDANFMLSVRSALNFEIAERFEAEGIEIPFAQRDVTLRNPEALANALVKAETGHQD